MVRRPENVMSRPSLSCNWYGAISYRLAFAAILGGWHSITYLFYLQCCPCTLEGRDGGCLRGLLCVPVGVGAWTSGHLQCPAMLLCDGWRAPADQHSMAGCLLAHQLVACTSPAVNSQRLPGHVSQSVSAPQLVAPKCHAEGKATVIAFSYGNRRLEVEEAKQHRRPISIHGTATDRKSVV